MEEFTFRERLIIEEYELLKKIAGLKQFFVDGSVYKKLTLRVKWNMKWQYHHMKWYAKALTSRMNYLAITDIERDDIIAKYENTINKVKTKTVKPKAKKNVKTKKD